MVYIETLVSSLRWNAVSKVDFSLEQWYIGLKVEVLKTLKQ